jgi:hypothetical protein
MLRGGNFPHKTSFMKNALIALSFMISLPLQAKTVCRVNVDGKTATQVESPVAGALAFSNDETTVIAQPVEGKPNRMQFTFLRPTKAAYVVAAFRGERLQAAPEINGQQMSVSCLRK